jgi:hypothetical protein
MNKRVSLWVPPTEEEVAAEQEIDDRLMERYRNDPELAKRADKIHHHRMMTGPACPSCIAMAIRQMEKK